MANLPTAYASQRFGRKTLDFYAVEGEVVGADPRARSDERRLEDIDGARHAVRLMEKGFELEPGQAATVLRMQPGPARRSRPVAVVNHTASSWCRTHPGAEGLLARAGVSRTLNWTLTMMLFALAAIALVWPFLRAFLVEVDAGLFGASPDFNLADLAVAALPALSGWNFSEAVAPVTAPLVAAAPAFASFADMLVFGAGVILATIGVYTLRSWRLLWAPFFVGALGAVSLGYGGVAGMVEPALSGLGMAAAVFLLGGLINRIRDGARLEARIAVLCDHLLRQGPQDAVVPALTDEPVEQVEPEADVEDAIPAVAATAAAASLRESDAGDVDAQAVPVEADDLEAVVEEAAAAERSVLEDIEAIEVETVDAEDAQDEAGDSADALVEEGSVQEVEAPTDTSSAPAAETPAHAQSETGPEVEAVTQAQDDAVVETEIETEVEVEGSGPAAEAEAGPTAATDVTETEIDGEARDQIETREPEPADLSADTTPAGLDPEEAERLRNDPRYASRAIVLPPPPPMPAPASALGEGSGEAIGRGETTTLKPSAPLVDNVIPIFAAPSSPQVETDTEATKQDDETNEPA